MEVCLIELNCENMQEGRNECLSCRRLEGAHRNDRRLEARYDFAHLMESR